jgi:hypothetical protein
MRNIINGNAPFRAPALGAQRNQVAPAAPAAPANRVNNNAGEGLAALRWYEQQMKQAEE